MRPCPALRLAALTAGAAVFLAALPARACDLCAIYTGSLMQQDKTGFLIGVAEQYSDFASVRQNGVELRNRDGEWIHSSITQILAGYGFVPWAGVQLGLPLISREYRRTEDGAPVRGDTGGLGDISLLARATPFSRKVGQALVHAELFAGLKLPTGDSDFLAEELEEHGEEEEETPGARSPRHGDEEHEDASAVHGHDLALGSGSVDGVFGVSLYSSWRRWFAQVAVQYALRGNGDFQYEYDDDLTWELGPGAYVVTDNRWTAALRFVTSGEYKGLDRQAGLRAGDSGITAVYVGPGAVLTWSDELHADLTVDLPVLQDTTGKQIVADYRLRGGLVWRF